jgi:hypothetical protein
MMLAAGYYISNHLIALLCIYGFLLLVFGAMVQQKLVMYFSHLPLQRQNIQSNKIVFQYFEASLVTS